MVGILLTLLAVLLLICFAFYFSDQPSGRRGLVDELFFVDKKSKRSDSGSDDLCGERNRWN